MADRPAADAGRPAGGVTLAGPVAPAIEWLYGVSGVEPFDEF